MKKLLILFITVGSSISISIAGLKLSSNGRYLTTSDGTPYLVMADAAWNLLHMLSTDSAKWYLSQRAQEGFNTFEIWLPSFASDNGVQTWPVTNRYGDAPFTGTPFQSSLNEAYWAHADTVIDYGISLGLSFVVFPAYAGYLNNTTADGGWGGEIDAATNHQMYVYGQTFGARYKNRTNIIWGMGGDMKISDYPTTWVRQDSMLKGIQNASDTHLVTNHSHRNTVGIDAWNNNSRITLNNIYIGDNAGTDTSIFRLGNAAWGISPARPYYLIEGRYESDPYSPTQQTLRAQAYQTMLLGGCGFTFGNSHLFNFGGDGTHFQNYLNTTGSNGQTYAKDLFTSRHWWNLVPDNSHTVLTAGYGTFGTSTYAIAASATDSSSIIAYLPTQRSITINPAVLKGDSIHVWWYNPSNTSVTDAGMYSKVSRSYNQPSPGDWVMVIDGRGFNFNRPGSPTSDTILYSNSLTLTAGWNLVSLPCLLSNFDANVVFPGKTGSMFTFNTATRIYDAKSILENGLGYWVNYPNTTTVTISGSAMGSVNVTATQPGWVLVGSQETDISISSLVLNNGAIRLGSVFQYNAVARCYQSTTLITPGDACWINVSKSCIITLP